jgi:uncharacterized protein
VAAEKAREILFGRLFTLITSSIVNTHKHVATVKVDNGARVKHVMHRIKIKKITVRFEKQKASLI